ncbi:MAG: hypothetical protein ACOCVC_07955 [Spirochaeta sp.]
MRSLQRSMKQAQQTVQDSHQTLEESWLDLGKAVAESSDVGREYLPEAVKESIENIHDNKEQLKQNMQMVEEIRQILARRDELKKQQLSLPKELRHIDNENRPIYRNVGEQALALYGHRELNDQILTDIFGEAREAARKQADTERTIDRLRNENGGLKKLANKLRISSLQAKLAIQRRAIGTAEERLGARLLQNDGLDRLTDPGLEAAASGYYHNESRKHELSKLLEKIQAELQAIEAQIEAFSNGKHPQRRLDEIQLESRSLEKEIETQQVRIGKSYFQTIQEKEESPPNSVSDLITRIQDLTSVIQSEQSRIERLEAAIVLKKLNTRRQELVKRVQAITRQIESQQREIAALQEEIAKTESRSSKLESIHGPLDSLLE